MPAAHPVLLLAAHLGQLHRYETALVLLVAFGPFVVITLLAIRERRRAASADRGSPDEAPPGPVG